MGAFDNDGKNKKRRVSIPPTAKVMGILDTIIMTVKLAIVVSRFSYEITGRMRKKAEKRAKELGARIIKTVEVPGAYEIPLAVRRLLDEKKADGVITIGTIIKGGTDHDAVIANAVARKLLDLSIEYKKPVSLGISGPNITWKQSRERVEDYAIRAVDAAVKMIARK